MMKNGCRLVLRNSRKKILILVKTWLVEFVDRLRRTMSRKLIDNNGEIETRLRFEILLKDYATCSQPCDPS